MKKTPLSASELSQNSFESKGATASVMKFPKWLIFLSIISLCATGIVFRYWDHIVPFVDLKVTVNQNEVCTLARQLAQTYGLGPEEAQQAVYFDSDQNTKLYVELLAGGTKRFQQLISERLYHPYTWRVRHYNPGSVHETLLIFTPDGRPYGFKESLPESEPGAALSKDEATTRAETFLREWGIDLDAYDLIDTSHQERTSGRIDYTLVYELREEKLSDARYRLTITLSGDQVTSMWHWIDVPEIAFQKYRQMRSSNELFSSIGNAFVYLLYLLIFAFFGGLWLLTHSRLGISNPYPALGVAIVLALFGLTNQINQLPFVWINYNTSASASSTLWHFFLSALTQFLSIFCVFTLSVFAGEGFTRISFGHLLKLWSSLKKNVLGSSSFAQMVFLGYLMVPLFLLYELVFQIVTTHWLSWWIPSALMVDPNILTTYIPSLTPLSQALTAGVWEEFLFRAIPLAISVYLGKRMGSATTGAVIGSVVQAFVFGCAHANYPNFPGYARIVELFIPALAFGWVYMRWGLIPVMITHFVYDLILMSSPLFISTASGIWVHRAVTIAAMAFPMLLVLAARIRSGRWLESGPEEYNSSHEAQLAAGTKDVVVAPIEETRVVSSPWNTMMVIPLMLIGSACFLFGGMFRQSSTPPTTTREEVLARSTELLAQLCPTGDTAHWKLFTHLSPAPMLSQEDLFVLERVGEKKWNALRGTYVPDTEWHVRAAPFGGPLEDRAYQLVFNFGPDGAFKYTQYTFPESMPGESLSEDVAQKIAEHRAVTAFGLARDDLDVWQVTSDKLPERKDWSFTFIHKADHPETEHKDLSENLSEDTENEITQDQARKNIKRLITVKLAGDQITHISGTVDVPQEWRTEYTKTTNYHQSIYLLQGMLKLVLSLLFMGLSIYMWINKRTLRVWTSLAYVLVFGGLTALFHFLILPESIYYFTTSQSYNLQLLMYIMSISIHSAIALVFLFWSMLWGTRPHAYPVRYAAGWCEKLLFGIASAATIMGVQALCRYGSVGILPERTDFTAINTLSPLLTLLTYDVLEISKGLIFFLACNALFATRRCLWWHGLLGLIIAVLSMPLLNVAASTWAITVIALTFVNTFLFRFVFTRMPEALVIGYATLYFVKNVLNAYNMMSLNFWIYIVLSLGTTIVIASALIRLLGTVSLDKE